MEQDTAEASTIVMIKQLFPLTTTSQSSSSRLRQKQAPYNINSLLFYTLLLLNQDKSESLLRYIDEDD
jgi:hypothetical protein